METCNEDFVNSGDISLETILSEGLEIPYCEDYLIFKEGFVVSLKGKTPKILKEAKGGYKRHYSFVVLSKNGKTKPVNIHTLVATAFLKKPEGIYQVNHIDGNTDNNNVANLEWVTPKENTLHALRTGLTPVGAKCSWAIHAEKSVRDVCSMLENGRTTTEIRLALELPSTFICKIKSRTNWKQVSKDYDF